MPLHPKLEFDIRNQLENIFMATFTTNGRKCYRHESLTLILQLFVLTMACLTGVNAH